MIQRLLPFLTLIVLFVALAIASPHFLTDTNLSSVVRQTAVINIMALGMTLIIVAGGIDLSVGAILAMGGLLGTMAMQKGPPIPAAVLIGIVTGMFWGFVNGLLTTRLRINPFHCDVGNSRHRARPDADHLQWIAGARNSGEVLISR
jgi:Ribose/xylose/arabinose/galactoside ABC-type transport systems, permease components